MWVRRDKIICSLIGIIVAVLWWTFHEETLVPYGVGCAIIVGLVLFYLSFLNDTVGAVGDREAVVITDPDSGGDPEIIVGSDTYHKSPQATAVTVPLDTQNIDREISFQPRGAADAFKWKVTFKVGLKSGRDAILDVIRLQPKDPKKALKEGTDTLVDQVVAAIIRMAAAEQQDIVNSKATGIVAKAVNEANRGVSSLKVLTANVTLAKKSEEDEEQDELARKSKAYIDLKRKLMAEAEKIWGGLDKIPQTELAEIDLAAKVGSGYMRLAQKTLQVNIGGGGNQNQGGGGRKPRKKNRGNP